MSKVRTCLLVLLALHTLYAHTQPVYKLSGKILADDFSPLVNAAVYIAKFSSGTFSDSTGQFVIDLPAGMHEVSFSYLGYKPYAVKLQMARDTFIEVKMKTDLQLGEVTIVDKKKLKAADHDLSGTITLRKENFLSLPALLGENDPMRAVQMQPGIQSGNEGSRGVFVRGGSPDQNLMLIDGTPVYNPSHLYGFISVFNGDAIDRIDVYKDKYPARFGGRLGSVMDIQTDAGNSNRIQGTISVGILTSRFHVEGPLDKLHNTTFAVSARVCYAGLYTSPISRHQYKAQGFNGDVEYYFGDVNVKLAHRFGKANRLEASYFSNTDYYLFSRGSHSQNQQLTTDAIYSEQLKWANYVAALAWVHQFNKSWQLSNTVSYSQYNITTLVKDHFGETYTGVGEWHNYYDSRSSSYIRDLSYRLAARAQVGKFQVLQLGGGVSGLMFLTGKGKATRDMTGYDIYTSELKNEHINAIESYAYAEDELKPTERWVINGGVHLRTYTVQRKTFVTFLPRVNVSYSPVNNFSLRASVSGLSQNLHLLTTATTDILNDYWVPATRVARPEGGWNFSGGVMQKLPLNFEWSLDGFYRIMNNLIDYKEGADYTSVTAPWEQQIATGGIGRAYGMEVYAARSYGRVTGSVAYTLAWSERKFESMNGNQYFPYKYDRRHNVAIQINYLVSKHIEIGASWVYGSGNMVTLPLQSYNSWVAVYYHDYNVQNGYHQPESGEQVTLYTAKNGYRLPSYQHLDLSFTYKKTVRHTEHRFNFSIYNAYNHFNIFEVYSDYRVAADGSRTVVFKQLSLFPVLPSLSYTVKFGA
jgi:hypothetical protein